MERLKNHESEELAVQISAYVDNEFDIAVLMEEAEEKVAAMERVADLEDEIGRLNETMQELEVDAMTKQVNILGTGWHWWFDAPYFVDFHFD